MAAEIVDVLKLVVADLATRVDTFTVTGWTPKRAFVPHYRLKDVRTVQVVTCPASLAGERRNRQKVARRLGIYVGVLKLLEATSADEVASDEDLEELDGLVLFMQQLSDLFIPVEGKDRYRLDGGRLQAVECTSVPLFSMEDMRESRQFTGVLSVIFEEQ